MKWFNLAVVMIIMMISSVCFGQDVPAEAMPPEWIGPILMWLKSVPSVGPILVEVLKWISVLVTVMTVISTCVQALLKIPEIAARIAGADKKADQIKKVSDKILPWLKYLSAYNVQTKKL